MGEDRYVTTSELKGEIEKIDRKIDKFLRGGL